MKTIFPIAIAFSLALLFNHQTSTYDKLIGTWEIENQEESPKWVYSSDKKCTIIFSGGTQKEYDVEITNNTCTGQHDPNNEYLRLTDVNDSASVLCLQINGFSTVDMNEFLSLSSSPTYIPTVYFKVD